MCVLGLVQRPRPSARHFCISRLIVIRSFAPLGSCLYLHVPFVSRPRFRITVFIIYFFVTSFLLLNVIVFRITIFTCIYSMCYLLRSLPHLLLSPLFQSLLSTPPPPYPNPYLPLLPLPVQIPPWHSSSLSKYLMGTPYPPVSFLLTIPLWLVYRQCRQPF